MDSSTMTKQATQIKQLEKQLLELRLAFCTMLIWIAQSANSPLRTDEINKLFKMVDKKS